jgi:alkylation response protein AidB-like acyl-CoA dehydrogenase
MMNFARSSLANVVGDMDHGWKVATALLSEERLRIGSPALALKALLRLRRMAASLPQSSRTDELLAQAEIETETLIASFLDVAEAEQTKAATDGSYLKILATEAVLGILDALQEIAGEDAPIRDAAMTPHGYLDYSEMFLQSRRLPIYGGTNEVQRNIIATKVLGMPTARRKQ